MKVNKAYLGHIHVTRIDFPQSCTSACCILTSVNSKLTLLVYPLEYSMQKISLCTRYTHVHLVPHAEHVKSSRWRSSKCCRDDPVLSSTYPVHGSASEVNRSGADVQVVSRHHYLVFILC